MKKLIKVFFVLVVLSLSGLLIFLYATKPGIAKIGVDKLKRQTEEKEKQKNIFDNKKRINILLLGATSTSTLANPESKERGQSDTIMLISIDAIENKVQVLSIPRDSWVKIKGHGERKINDAYVFGDVPLSVDTIENLLDTYIDHYVVVKYDIIEQLVDALGGVDIEWNRPDYKYEDNWIYPPLKIDLKRGINHLNGRETVAYLRARKAYRDSDLGRIDAQQGFLMQIFKELKSPSTILLVPKLLEMAVNNVETDLSYGDIAYLATWGLKLNSTDIRMDKITGDFAKKTQSGVQVDVIDLYKTQAIKKLHEFPFNFVMPDRTQEMESITVGN